MPFEIYGTPGLPYFPETNLRTYIVGPDGSRAVWFFSLEASRLAAVIGARIAYHLPYFWASMRVSAENDAIHYQGRRRWPHEASAITDIAVQSEASPSDLTERDHFLTARYRLYTLARGNLWHANIEHPPWPHARAKVRELHETLFARAGLPHPIGPPLAHYAGDVPVKIGRLELH